MKLLFEIAPFAFFVFFGKVYSAEDEFVSWPTK